MKIFSRLDFLVWSLATLFLVGILIKLLNCRLDGHWCISYSIRHLFNLDFFSVQTSLDLIGFPLLFLDIVIKRRLHKKEPHFRFTFFLQFRSNCLMILLFKSFLWLIKFWSSSKHSKLENYTLTRFYFVLSFYWKISCFWSENQGKLERPDLDTLCNFGTKAV